eukprot:119846-Rhodomonas_salina.1
MERRRIWDASASPIPLKRCRTFWSLPPADRKDSTGWMMLMAAMPAIAFANILATRFRPVT